MRIGASKAKNSFADLLRRAKRGQEIVITRHGRPVAKLVPFSEARNVERAREAAERLRNHAKAMKLGRFDWEEWKKFRDEGRP
jgi:prevent-host-death family protein